jgi:hypothetical protein
MAGLVIFLAGLIILVMVEPLPKWLKTLIWIALIIVGVIGGALPYLKVG